MSGFKKDKANDFNIQQYFSPVAEPEFVSQRAKRKKSDPDANLEDLHPGNIMFSQTMGKLDKLQPVDSSHDFSKDVLNAQSIRFDKEFKS